METPLHTDEWVVSQCAELRPGPTCELDADDRTLTVWWKRTLKEPSFATDRGVPTTLERESTEHGTLLRLEVPAQSTVLRATLEGGQGKHTWQLRLSHRTRDARLAQARALRREGRTMEAADLVDQALSEAVGTAHWELLSLRGRLFLDQGNIGQAVAALEASLGKLETQGLRSHATQDAFALAFTLISRLHDPERAHAVLDHVRRWSERPPDHDASLHYYEGLVSKASADVRAAVASFRLARDAAARTRSDIALFARRELAALLTSMGRPAEALAIHREILPRRLKGPCDPSDVRVNFALTVVALQELGQTVSPELAAWEQPLALLERAEQLLGPCRDPWRRRNITIERVRRAFEHGDTSQAHTLLDQLAAQPGGRTPLLDAWEYESRGMLALLEAQPARALAWFERQGSVARRAALREETFRADVGLGNALMASGAVDAASTRAAHRAALRAYRSAESTLDELLLNVPFGMGVHGFAALHRRSAADLVRALVRLRMPAEAAEAARKARLRSLLHGAAPHRIAALAEPALARWRAALGRYEQLRAEADALSDDKVPMDELSALQSKRASQTVASRAALDAALLELSRNSTGQPTCFPRPRAGELRLLFHRDGTGYLGFALSDAQSVARELGPLPSETDAESLGQYFLDPFAAEISASQELTLLLPDELWSIDFHRLRFQEQPLLARAPISYGVDLCRPTEPAPATARAHVLLIADPTGDLPRALDEAEVVAQLVASEGAPLTQLTGSAANHAGVRGALEGAWLLHYAGHGQHAGVEGYDSALPLAQHTELSLADLLTLTAAPERVILSACEGAKLAREGGISMAHAFVAAGSAAVVAAPQRVSDAATEQLTTALYQHGAARPDVALSHALRAVQLGLPADAEGWSFRVVTR